MSIHKMLINSVSELIGFSILNHEDREDREEKMLAHLATEQLDIVIDRVEVAHHIVDSAVFWHER